MLEQIKKIDHLIQLDGKKIIRHKVKRLTAPGDNYGSLMLSVEITVQSTEGTEEIHTVAKMVPPNEFLQKVFNTPVTFRNEIGFYNHIVPLLQKFQKENGVEEVVDFAPKYFGSRLNLDGGDEVDADAALVLENLKTQGYITLDQRHGCDLDVAKLVLVDLAYLHAVSLALKLQKPQVFEKEILPYLVTWAPPNHSKLKQGIAGLIDQLEELQPLKEQILVGFDKMAVLLQPREPFATITHNDCWTNNYLVKFEDGTPTKTKLVDYQVCCYGSPARDVLFFLFSSVKSHILEKHYDDLLKKYHETFISVLKKLKCDPNPFSFEEFQKEMDFEARTSQFGHVIFMLFPIFAEKDNIKDIPELTEENMLQLGSNTDLHKRKFVFVVNEFLKRNWI